MPVMARSRQVITVVREQCQCRAAYSEVLVKGSSAASGVPDLANLQTPTLSFHLQAQFSTPRSVEQDENH